MHGRITFVLLSLFLATRIAEAQTPRQLVQALREAKSPEQSVQAFDALARLGPKAIPALAAATMEEDLALRSQALLLLSRLDQADERLVPIYLAVLDDPYEPLHLLQECLRSPWRHRAPGPEYQVRNTARSLLHRAGASAQTALLAALKHPRTIMRRESARLLGELAANTVGPKQSDRQVVRALIPLLEDRHDGTRIAVLEALLELQSADSAAFPALRARLKSKNDWEAELAAKLLGRLGSTAAPAVDDLLDIFHRCHDLEKEDYSSVLNRLQEIGPAAERAIEPILGFYASLPDFWVPKYHATTALAKLNHRARFSCIEKQGVY